MGHFTCHAVDRGVEPFGEQSVSLERRRVVQDVLFTVAERQGRLGSVPQLSRARGGTRGMNMSKAECTGQAKRSDYVGVAGIAIHHEVDGGSELQRCAK